MQILNRRNGKVIFDHECQTIKELVLKAVSSDADLRGADLRGAILSDADLSGAILRDADLSGADLRAADLSGADLSDAILRDADLSDAILRDADLRGAILRDAILSGAILRDAETPDLDGKIIAEINAGGTIKMDAWHTCETTHCRAGWAVTVCPKGKELEERCGTETAAILIYLASYPEMRIPNFYASDEAALADIKARAALAL